MNGKYLTKEEIIIIADQLVGTKFKELGQEVDEKNKGAFGLTIESDAFGIAANSRKEADFVLAGYELKVTPIKKNKNGTISSKERLVLNIINYMTENTDDFYKSSLWKKNEVILILFYLFEENISKGDMSIVKSYLFDYPEKDKQIIINDWKIIANKIKKGKAHELSEADTMYLGACTKGKNSKSLRFQPNSEIKAKQRAYSFKNSYMTQLVRNIIGNNKDVENVLENNVENLSIEDYIKNKTYKYINHTRTELCEIFKIDSKAKNLNELIISRMFNIKGKISKTDEFLKANIQVKTIRVEKNGNIKESMSFPYFKYTEIIKESWESSTLRNLFEQTKFMFAVFQNDGYDYIFKKIIFWNMPETIIDNELKIVWDETVDLIKNGKIVKYINNGVRYTYFPGSKENSVVHVRPHGRDKRDVAKLPVPDILTGSEVYLKHCFWLNSSYIKKILEENTYANN
jgi:DNA mismatch repair protein MutH